MDGIARFDLVGCRITAGVGDPWYFESAAGPNLLEGEVLAVSEIHAEIAWLLCQVLPFEYEGVMVDQLLVVAKDAATQPLSALMNGARVPARMWFDPTGTALVLPDPLDVLLDGWYVPPLVGAVEVSRAED